MCQSFIVITYLCSLFGENVKKKDRYKSIKHGTETDINSLCDLTFNFVVITNIWQIQPDLEAANSNTLTKR